MRTFFATGSQTQEKRRSFAFMNYSPDRRSNTSMRRTREHAKKIAMQITTAEPPPSQSPFADFDPFPSAESPTPSTEDAASVASGGSWAYNMDVIDPMATAHKKKSSLDMFVEQHAASRRNSGSSAVSTESPRNKNADRTVNSMPTFPSNSSMQARNIGLSPGTPVNGPAARRRMRKLKHQGGTSSAAGSDFESVESDPFRVTYTRTESNGSVHSSRSGRDHVANYAQNPGRTRPIPMTPVSRSNSSSSSQNNIFTDDPHGFSFDAFGLDEDQLNQEVSAAIHDLAGFHPSIFGGDLGDEEFPPVSFDSPAGSSRSSPVVDGDGFQVTSMSGLPIHIRHSPTSSERSSLTSTSNDRHQGQGGSVNMFKVQAGFHKSRRAGAPQDRPLSPNWANFGRPPMSPPFSRSKSEPGNAIRRTPDIPYLVERLAKEADQQKQQVQEFGEAEKSEGGALSEGGAPSEGCAPSEGGAPSEGCAPSEGGAPSEVPLASDVGVASDGGVNSDIGIVPVEVLSSSKKQSKSKDLIQDDNVAGESVEPKKSPTFSTLKDAWEQREFEEMEKEAKRVQERQRARSPLDAQEIQRLESQLGDEILTPEKVETKWPHSGGRFPILKKQEKPPRVERAEGFQEKRMAFESHRERLKPTTSKSDYAGYRSSPPPEMQSVLKRMNHSDQPTLGQRETKSDVGNAPAFLAAVKLRNTGGVSKFDEKTSRSPQPSDEDDQNERHLHGSYKASQQIANYQGQQEAELPRPEESQARADEVFGDVVQPKKLTYKEKRELELRQQRAEQERKEAEERAKRHPERDVVSLIRRRIAANKKGAARGAVGSDVPEPELASLRNQLKKVQLDETRSPQMEGHSNAVSPIQSVTSPLQEIEPEAYAPQTSVAPTSQHSQKPPKTECSESNDSPHPPSMISSEVDSSSTIRSYVEIPNSSSQQPQHTAKAEPLSAARHPEKPREVSVATEASEGCPLSPRSTKSMLNSFFANRNLSRTLPESSTEQRIPENLEAKSTPDRPQRGTLHSAGASVSEARSSPAKGSRPALKDDPKYDRYFRMLKVGMPMEVVKHAMTRDGVDPSVMDGDHTKPAGCGGVPLKEDPKYTKYFKMIKMGLPMGAVKNAMERDGMDPSVMDGDHNLPAGACASKETKETKEENKPKDTHRRTRLHWETLRKVRSNSLWAKIDNDPEVEQLDIDEEEFAKLFQAELTPSQLGKSKIGSVVKKRGAAVRVIDAKRANNGGIILARLKMTHDDMADAVDRIDDSGMTSEQMQNIIEFLPTSEERKALEAYMLEGGQDAAEKFDGLCECEKFMVSMMTVKYAKRKVRALLFKLQFGSCLDSLEQDARMVETACDELSNSVRLRKLLGIVLNIGNRLNTAGVSGKRKAGAFTLNSLLKLSHAKAFDKKTTFLDYVILVVQRNNEILLRFKDDLPTALKADKVYWDQVLSDLEEVENQLENVRRVALHQAQLQQIYRLKKKTQKGDDDSESLSDVSMSLEEEVEALRSTQIGIFTLGAIKKVSSLRDKVELTKKKFARLLEYFGEEDKPDMQPHELFSTIARFSRDFDKAKERVFSTTKKKLREERKQKASDKMGASKTTSSTQTGVSDAVAFPASKPKETAKKIHVSNMQPNLSFVLNSLPSSTPSTQSKVESSRVDGDGNGSTPPLPKYSPPRTSSQSEDHHFKAANSSSSVGSSMSRASSETKTSLRQKVRMRRKLAQTAYSSSTSVTSATTATSTLLDGRPPLNQVALSPRSTIRQRRRMEQRKDHPQDFAMDELRLEVD